MVIYWEIGYSDMGYSEIYRKNEGIECQGSTSYVSHIVSHPNGGAMVEEICRRLKIRLSSILKTYWYLSGIFIFAYYRSGERDGMCFLSGINKRIVRSYVMIML